MWDELNEKTGKRVLRGGDCNGLAEYCAVAYRYFSNPGNRYGNFGFRVALSSGP
jgi:formylglycine-generating enzyme required for sulfatase activity